MSMSKIERVLAAIAGDTLDRPPVALWRHFPGDDQDPNELAAATVHFQREYDFDLVKVSPASSFCLRDWGARDVWMGNMEGTREYTARPITQPDDWLGLRPLDPGQGALGAQLECLRRILAELGSEVPVIQTVFSPLAQAKNLVGEGQLAIHLRRYPEALHAGLATIAQATTHFVRAVRDLGAAGVFYAVQQAQYGLLSEAEFAAFGRSYDVPVLEAASGMWCNVLHLHGTAEMFEQVCDYTVQVLNWHDQETPPNLAEGLRRSGKAVCGGLERWRDVVRGDPAEIAARAAEAIAQTGGRRFILGTGCVTPIVAPRVNIQAVRASVGE